MNHTRLIIGFASLVLLAPAAQSLAAEGDIAAGEALYAESCVSCHGRAGRGMASFPAITGRDASYITERLEQYRAGERVGANTPLMAPHAADLSDDDIANLAAFIADAFQ